MLRGDTGIDEEERKMIEDGACNLPLRMERGQIEREQYRDIFRWRNGWSYAKIGW